MLAEYAWRLRHADNRGRMESGGAVKDELGGTVGLYKVAGGSVDSIIDRLRVGSFEQPEVREKGVFLARRAGKHLCECSAFPHAHVGGRLSVTRRIGP